MAKRRLLPGRRSAMICAACKGVFYARRIDAWTCNQACRKALSRYIRRHGAHDLWLNVDIPKLREPSPSPW